MGTLGNVTADFGNWKDCRIVLDYYESGSVKAELRSNSNQLLLAPSVEIDMAGYDDNNILCMKRSNWSQKLINRLCALNLTMGWFFRENLVYCVLQPLSRAKNARQVFA